MDDATPHAATDAKTVVAQTSILTVEACACGVFHLHFGPVSMRFTEQGLENVSRTISEALLRFAAHEAQSATVAPLFATRSAARGEA